MNSNEPNAPDEFELASPRSRRGRWIAIAGTLTIVLVPLLWAEVPVEIARWYHASAKESDLDGDSTQALLNLDRALEWSPYDPNLYLYRANLRLRLNQPFAALEDAEQAVALAPARSIEPLSQRALVLQRLGRHKSALRDIDRVVRLVGDETGKPRIAGQGPARSYDEVLNFRAYSRALAKLDLERALEDIENAIARAGDELSFDYLDTRGYILLLLGELAGAKQDMERAVELAEKALLAHQASKRDGDERSRRLQENHLHEILAVLYHHRGLVYQQLGDLKSAERDLSRADEFGYCPDEGVW